MDGIKRAAVSVAALILMLLFSAELAAEAHAAGSAPVAENLELNTLQNLPITGRLNAKDPDGDVAAYEITTRPIKGEIRLEADGSYVYTPGKNKKGRDYFGYRAIDARGNVSQEATALIRIGNR